MSGVSRRRAHATTQVNSSDCARVAQDLACLAAEREADAPEAEWEQWVEGVRLEAGEVGTPTEERGHE